MNDDKEYVFRTQIRQKGISSVSTTKLILRANKKKTMLKIKMNILYPVRHLCLRESFFTMFKQLILNVPACIKTSSNKNLQEKKEINEEQKLQPIHVRLACFSKVFPGQL